MTVPRTDLQRINGASAPVVVDVAASGAGILFLLPLNALLLHAFAAARGSVSRVGDEMRVCGGVVLDSLARLLALGANLAILEVFVLNPAVVAFAPSCARRGFEFKL